MSEKDKPYQYKVTTFPPEDDPGWFEADVWGCKCGVKKIAEDCPECPGCLAPQPEGSVYRGRCWGMKLPEILTLTTGTPLFPYKGANFKVSLADLPRREPKEEVCEHCGATYTGLSHCQSLTQIKEIDDYAIQPRHRAWLENVWCWDSEFIGTYPLAQDFSELQDPEMPALIPADGMVEYGHCPVCGAEPGQQCSVTDVSGWQPEGPAYVSTTELAGWVHPEREVSDELG